MPRPPSLTVALPTYNGARHLAQALRSILAQDEAGFDLLVCDDRSDDETLSIIRAEAGDRARIEVNSERLGLAGNWNKCVESSRTEWVSIFHQDDVMLSGNLGKYAAAIADDPNGRLGLVAGPASVIDDDGQPVPPSVVEPGELPISGQKTGHVRFDRGAFVPHLSERNSLRCSAVLTRRDAHLEVGGFDPFYRYVVDWNFWLRIARHWEVSWLVGEPTVAFRWHLASETHRFKTGTADLEEQVRLLDAIYSEDARNWPDARSRRRSADRRLARAYLNRAYEATRSSNRELMKFALARAVKLSPAILGRIAADPRLAIRLILTSLRINARS